MITLELVLTSVQLAFLLPLALLGFHRGYLVWRLAVTSRRGHAERERSPAPPAGSPPPRVTVQLPVYNERYVAARLIEAAAGLDWPRERLQLQVLDDSTDDTTEVIERALRRLPADLDVQHLRRPVRDGYKAGALANGLEHAAGEFVAVFDADFVPPADFLQRTIPHFADPRVGMVQARWEHRNAGDDLLAEMQATLLDGHFLVEHVARARSGCLFNFNGTAGVFRRAAITAAGGWQGDTLTEDLDLSYRAQLAGWRFVYLPELACPADLPTEMSAFLNQQHRWAKGSIQTARKLLGAVLRAPELSVKQKLEATFHLCGNVAFPLLLMVFVTALPLNLVRWHTGGGATPAPLAALEGLPVLLATLCVLCYYGIARWRAGRLTVASLLRLPLLFGIGAGMCLNNTKAVFAALRRERGAFLRTPKPNLSRARAPIVYRSHRGLLPIGEIALAIWVGTTAWIAFSSGRTGTAAFFALFAAGLLWTGSRSVRESLVPPRAPAALSLSSARS